MRTGPFPSSASRIRRGECWTTEAAGALGTLALGTRRLADGWFLRPPRPPSPRPRGQEGAGRLSRPPSLGRFDPAVWSPSHLLPAALPEEARQAGPRAVWGPAPRPLCHPPGAEEANRRDAPGGRTPWRRRDPSARPLTGNRAGTARPAAAGRAAPYHVGQRELGALSKHAAVHGDHGAAVVVQPVPVAALLIGQQVNPPVLENTARRRVSSAAQHLRPQRPKTGRSAEPAAAAPGPRPPRGPPSGTHAHGHRRRGARETRRASRGPSATGTVSPDSPERRHCPPPRGRHGRAEHTEPREAPEAQRQPDAPVPRATEPHGRAVPRWPRLAAMPTGERPVRRRCAATCPAPRSRAG